MLNHETRLLTNSPSKQSLHEACAGICRRFGFQYFLFISKIPNKPRPKLMIIQGTSGDESTVSQKRCGVMRISAHSNVSSMEADNLLRHFASDHKQQLMNILLSNQVDIPLVNSVSFPVTGTNGDIGLLIFATSTDICRSSATTTQLSYAQEFALRIHQAIISLAQNDDSRANQKSINQKLTKRELECLHWAAAGKTNWEIGKILGVSKRTVVFHLHNSTTKLQTSNRYHTVARAVSMGLINRLD